MKKVNFVIDIVLAAFMMVLFIWNFLEGIKLHDAYYLVLAYFDYIVMYFSIKNIEKYIDEM